MSNRFTELSTEHLKRLDRSNTLAEWAVKIAALSFIVSAGSLYYAHLQTEQARKQTEQFQQQSVDIRRQTKMQEADYRERLTANINVRFDVIDEAVQLVIENNGGSWITIPLIIVDHNTINKHFLFESSQFNPDKTDMRLAPGSSKMFLTVASVPTARNVSQSINHPVLSIRLYCRDDEEILLTVIERQVGFPRKLIFPSSYIQWRQSTEVK